MSYEIRPMQIGDYAEVLALWQRTQGIGLSGADELEAIRVFLERNPGLCYTASIGQEIIGTVLCGFDGRRGYLYHLAIDSAYRHQGIGRALLQRSLDELHRMGGQKCHLMVYFENTDAQAFYRQVGWDLRQDIVIMSKDLGCHADGSAC